MKKSSLFSVVALLATVAFLFTACPEEPEDENNTPTTFTVTFDAGEGVTDPAPSTGIASGTTITLPTPPTKSGYTFGGWFTAVNGGGTEFTASTSVTASITVYAKWTANETPGTFTVTFSAGEGVTDPAPTTGIASGTTITLPTAPTKSGHTFGGWFTAVNGGGTEFTASTSVTASITVYAKWVARTVLENTTVGTAAVKAKYTITITTALAADETLTITNVTEKTNAEGKIAYTLSGNENTATLQATAIAALFTGDTYALYTATVATDVVTLEAKTAGVITNDPSLEKIATSATATGTVTEATDTAGASGTAAKYTLTIGTALATGETLTITNVTAKAGSEGSITYTPASSGENTAALQATAIKALIDADTDALYTATANAGVVTLEAKTTGVITNDPDPSVTAPITGVVDPLENTIQGANSVAAVYKLTINGALPSTETLTITNVTAKTGSEGSITYTPASSGENTAALQATAIVALFTGDTYALYTVAVIDDDTDNKIKLTAKTAGAITDVPAATIE
jgi:uncharacterized repeat protein (TIGR02543 family)